MKMVKKVLMGLAVAAAVFTLAGCGDMAGAGAASGSKYKKTITVDATGTLATVTKADGSEGEAKYRRYIKELSSNEKTAAIKSTITIPKADLKLVDADDNVVVGYIFDMNGISGYMNGRIHKKFTVTGTVKKV